MLTGYTTEIPDKDDVHILPSKSNAIRLTFQHFYK